MTLRVSALRGLGAYMNVFTIENAMDEPTARAGVDPVEFRLRHLADERARAVADQAALRSPMPSPTHRPSPHRPALTREPIRAAAGASRPARRGKVRQNVSPTGVDV